MGFLIAGFLALACCLGGLIYETRTLREEVLRLRRSCTAADAAYTGWFRTLEGAVMDCRKETEQLRADVQSMADEDYRTAESLGKLWVTVDRFEKAQTAAMRKLEDRQKALIKRVEAGDSVRQRLLLQAACLEKIRKTAPTQTEELRKLRDDVGGLAHELKLLAGPAVASSDLDSRLSKSMEEGVMNLMQYAAGKTSGGVEVGFG